MNDIEKRFNTHNNYIKTLRFLSQDLKINLNNQKIHQVDKNAIKDKLKLIHLTIYRIKTNKKIIEHHKEYSQPSCMWIPIECYYAVYHTLSIVFRIIHGDKITFPKKNNAETEHTLKLGHGRFQQVFRKLLTEEFSFSNNHIFNNIYKKIDIDAFNIISGQHFRTPNDNNYHEFFEQIIKKISKDKYDEIKDKHKNDCEKLKNDFKIKSNKQSDLIIDKVRQKKEAKEKLKEQILKEKDKSIEKINNQKFCILDYFYINRLRVNYDNVNFTEGIDDKKTSDFCLNYIDFTLNFLKPFHDFITQSTTHK
jgi:hypothetical protein